MGKPKKSKAAPASETFERTSLKRSTPAVSESDYSQMDATAPFSDKSKPRSIFGTTSSFDSRLSVGSFEESASILITDGERVSRSYAYVNSTIVRPISSKR